MKNYILYAGVGEGVASEVERGTFHSAEDARERAHYLACELYHLDPKRDILDIVFEVKADYDLAKEVYEDEMNQHIDFYVEEIHSHHGITFTQHS